MLLLSPPVVELVHEGGADLPALALIVWAAAVELDRPRRAPALVLGLLALAGLLRPEAWLLSLAYLAWLRRFEPRLVALALAAPVLWALTDLLVTGDPLWSVAHTRDGTEILDRETGLGAARRAAAAARQLPRRPVRARRRRRRRDHAGPARRCGSSRPRR